MHVVAAMMSLFSSTTTGSQQNRTALWRAMQEGSSHADIYKESIIEVCTQYAIHLVREVHMQWSLYFKTTHGIKKMWSYIAGGLKIKVI